MPNRIIKESICISRKINSLSPEEEVFFYRLLVNCDDFGAFYGDPMVLAGRLFSRKKYDHKTVCKWRDRVVSVGLITVYRVDGEEYIQVGNWLEHQRQRTMRRKYPPLETAEDDGQTTDDCPQNAASYAHAESESNPNPIHTPTKTKLVHGEFMNVLLTEEERDKVNPDEIENLSRYLESTGKKYKSHYATMLNWRRRNGTCEVIKERNWAE